MEYETAKYFCEEGTALAGNASGNPVTTFLREDGGTCFYFYIPLDIESSFKVHR